MSLIDLGKNDVSEETQALKDKLASRDTENAGLRTQLMRREAELEELQATLNETVYKLSKEAERALRFEEEVSVRSSELKTERMSLRNTELALQSAQEKLRIEERAKKELESTLDTISLHSQATNVEHQSVQRDKRALESRVRELERIVQTHEAKSVSNVTRKNGRPRSSSVSNFRLPAVEQELNDTKAQLHARDINLRALEQKLVQTQNDLVKAENARISMEKASEKRILELLSTLEKKEEELESQREAEDAGEREEELLKRIDEDAAKIAALEKLVAQSQVDRTSQARIQKLQSQLKAECEKVHRGEDLQNRLLHEKEEVFKQYEVSRREIDATRELLAARECQIKKLQAEHADLVAKLDVGQPSVQSQTLSGIPGFTDVSAVADHIQTLLQAIDRLRDERDGLKRALEFSEVEYHITTEGFQSRIASLTRQLTEGTHDMATNKPSALTRKNQRIKQLISCAAAFSMVIANLQARLGHSEDCLSTTSADLASSNSKLNDALAVIDDQKQLLAMNAHERDDLLQKVEVAIKKLSESTDENNCLRLQLTDVEGRLVAAVEHAETSEAAREEAHQSLLSIEQSIITLNKNCQDIESERNSLALQITNLQDDLARAQSELSDTQNRYNRLHAQQLSDMSTPDVIQALKGRIQELETRLEQRTDQIGDYQHDIRRLEANVKLQENRIAEMVLELELLASHKEAMVEDCAEARKTRDEAIEKLEAVEEEAEGLHQQLQQVKHAQEAELSAMSLLLANSKSENQQTHAHLADLEAENTRVIHELDSLTRDHDRLKEQLDAVVSRSRSLELESSEKRAEMQQVVISLAMVRLGYRDSVRRFQRSQNHISSLESQLVTLNEELEQKSALVDAAERDKLQQLSAIATSSQNNHDLKFLRDSLEEREQELVTARQSFEEAKSHHAEVEAELLERIATITGESRAQAGQAEEIASLRVELENVEIRLQDSLQNFAELEQLHDGVIQEFSTAKEDFERRLTETDNQIHTLDADHQHSLAAMEAKYRHEVDILTSSLEDREHEVDELRQQLQDISEAHAQAEGRLHEELTSYEARYIDLEKDLRRTIADMHQRLVQTEAETLELQEERQLLQVQITGLQAESQRSTSLSRYLENRVRESEDVCMLLKDDLQRMETSLVDSEKAAKAAEFNLTLQTNQHEKAVAALRREIASLQSGPELRSALADLEERNREMDELLRAKCQEIEEYDDRILETLKANKKLTSKVESLTRKLQALQAKLSSMKCQPQESIVEPAPPKRASFTPSSPIPVPAAPQTRRRLSSPHVQESSVPPVTWKPKTPEPQPQSMVDPPPSRTPGKTSESFECVTSAGKKRPAPDDDERDSVPAEGHYSMDVYLRNGPTPRLRRAHGHPAGFTPVRGASSRKVAGLPSPGRLTNTGVMPSEIITDVTNSPRGPSAHGEAQLKKRSWLGKIRNGAGSQPVSSRTGGFGGQ